MTFAVILLLCEFLHLRYECRVGNYNSGELDLKHFVIAKVDSDLNKLKYTGYRRSPDV